MSSYGTYGTSSGNKYVSNPGESYPMTYDTSNSSYSAPGASTSSGEQYTLSSGTLLPPRFGDTPFDGCRCGIKDGLCGVILLPPHKDTEKKKKELIQAL